MENYVENKSVALIGNAESLFDSQHGSDIDDHQVVIRINNSAIFYNDNSCRHSVGTKIDIWAFWDWLRHATSMTTDKPNRMIEFESSNNYLKLDLNMGSKESPFVYKDNEFGLDIKQRCRKETGNPSAGLICLYLLNELNPSVVNVYGFDFKKTKTFHHNTNMVDGNRWDSFYRHDYAFEEEYCKNKFFSQERFNLIGDYNG